MAGLFSDGEAALEQSQREACGAAYTAETVTAHGLWGPMDWVMWLNDNTAAVALINKGTSSSRAMRPFGARLSAAAMSSGSRWVARHLSGDDMILSGVDLLSRLGEARVASRRITSTTLWQIKAAVAAFQQSARVNIHISGVNCPPLPPGFTTGSAPRAGATQLICAAPHHRREALATALEASPSVLLLAPAAWVTAHPERVAGCEWIPGFESFEPFTFAEPPHIPNGPRLAAPRPELWHLFACSRPLPSAGG